MVKGKEVFFWLLIIIVCVSCVIKYESESKITGNYITPNENCPESQIILRISDISNGNSSFWNSQSGIKICYTDFFGENYVAPNYNKQISPEELNDYSIKLIGGSNGNYISPKTEELNESDIANSGCTSILIFNYTGSEWVRTYDKMTKGKGYWVRVGEDCIVNYTGSPRYSGLSADIYPGWNAIGFGVNVSFDEVLFNKKENCYGISNPLVWNYSSSAYVKASSFKGGNLYLVSCSSETGSLDAYPFGQISTGHYCSGTNSIIWLNKYSSTKASLNQDSTYNIPICFGNLHCTQTNSKLNCNALGGKVILGLSASTNANVSLENRANFSINLCCSNNALVCTSNWTAINTSCKTGDILETWYNDTSNCNSSSNMPANTTYKCDYDNNGFIGNFSSFSQTRLNLEVYLDSSLGNVSKVYNSTKKIEFKESNVSIIEFEYNFSKSGALDFKNIEITKQVNSSSFGYLIVKGMEFNKTIRVDKLSDKSNSVCIRNSQSAQISSFSNNCDTTSEVLLACPGNYSQYSCKISNSKFVVSGLTSSAVKEMIFSNEEECISDWSCEEWGECEEGTRARVCIDLNECEADKVEEESCSVGVTQCIPNWECEEWSPTECPKTGEQERVCTDSNNCDVLTNKPAESKNCQYEFSDFIFWILLIILISLILIAVLLIVYSYQKRLNP